VEVTLWKPPVSYVSIRPSGRVYQVGFHSTYFCEIWNWELNEKLCQEIHLINTPTNALKLNSVALVRKRTIPTERPPPVGELVPTFADRGVSRGQRNGSPQPLISVF